MRLFTRLCTLRKKHSLLLDRPLYINPFFQSQAKMSSALTQVLASSVAIADRAGDIVRDIMKKGELGIVEKTGADDLQTQADRSAQNCIVASLAKQFPDLTVVGEEGEQDLSGVPDEWIVTKADSEAVKVFCPEQFKSVTMKDLTVWVDPLDGTKEYTQVQDQ